MSATLDWYPKAFTAGDMEGQGALKLLGKPTLPLVAVLVRETAQNSWDARLPGRSVDFALHQRVLDLPAHSLLRDGVFANPGQGTGLAQLLGTESLNVLEISDRGTGGLGGPVRNDRIYASGVTTDYVDFVLNIGARRDKSMGGGTYGYGKTICYLASSARTVVIWTRAVVDGAIQSRLIASAFGDQFDLDGRRYTGRQWWGSVKDNLIEPLVADAADQLGQVLFDRQFAHDETGTSMLILDPILSEDVSLLMPQISTAVLWHLWPKLVPDNNGHLPMNITLKQEGRELELPDPSRHDFLRGYVQSLMAVRASQADESGYSGIASCEPIEMRSPRVRLGHLAISRMPCLNAEESDDPLVPVSGVSSSIALMRHEAELVVSYLRQPVPPIDSVHFCGVFKPAASVDTIFAQAEPPAHDSWEPAGMNNARERRHVNVALRELRAVWTRQTRPDTAARSTGASVALGTLSASLSDLVPALSGTRAGPSLTAKAGKGAARKKRGGKRAASTGERSSASGPGARRNRLNIVESGLAQALGGFELAYVHFDIQGEITGLKVMADIGVGYDGGTDTDSAGHYVRGIHYLPGHELRTLAQQVYRATPTGNVLQLLEGEPSRWTLAVLFDPEVAVDIALRLRQMKGV